MNFKDNLKKKIEINRLAKIVESSVGPVGSGRKIDRESMRRLLEMGLYEYKKERDLDIYFKKGDNDINKVLVLDNDLPIYNTTIEDVAMRKSPTVKEMISIRNIIKILNDTDVVMSKKEESLQTVQQECIRLLDLSFDESDIEAIQRDASMALEIENTDEVIESLSLFAELLGYTPPPKILKIAASNVLAGSIIDEEGKKILEPVILYNRARNSIKLIDDPIITTDKGRIEFINKVAMGEEKALLEGPEVFQFLKNAVMRQAETG